MSEKASVLALLDSVSASLKSSANSLPRKEELLDTSNGISLLSLKSHLLLSYLQHITFYVLLKLRGEDTVDGEYKDVVENLIDLRVYLERGVKPLEAKLKYQIDKVIRAADRADREGQMKDLGTDAQDALAYRPNPQALVNDKEGDEIAENDGLYRPPRISSVLPAQESKARRKAPNNTLREFVDAELSAAPIAEPSIGSNIVSTGSGGGIQSRKLRDEEAAKTRYEEENYTRLASEGGKKKKGKRMDDIYGGEDFRVLDEELYDFRSGTNESLVERSRKRNGEETQPEGPSDLGQKFKKRRKALAKRQKRR